MNVTQLKRDASRIRSALKELPDGSLVATKDLQIHIPARYHEKNLASSGNETYVVGHFAYVDTDGFYAVNRTNSMLRIAPITQSKYNYEGMDYVVYEFPKGSTVVENMDLIVNNDLPFDVFVFYVDQALIPWWMNYEDLGKLFQNSAYYSEFRVGADVSIFEAMVATIARNPKDLNEYYRHTLKTAADLNKRPGHVPFKSVIFGPRSPMAKLLGNYINQAIPSALVNEADQIDSVEKHLRS
jgi:hypothetical protein